MIKVYDLFPTCSERARILHTVLPKTAFRGIIKSYRGGKRCAFLYLGAVSEARPTADWQHALVELEPCHQPPINEGARLFFVSRDTEIFDFEAAEVSIQLSPVEKCPNNPTHD